MSSTGSKSVGDTWVGAPAAVLTGGHLDACLVHIYPSGPTRGRRYPLGGEAAVLGRSDTATIQVQDNSCSRNHARIESNPAGFYLTDTKSLNGTFVNDQPTRGAYLLQDGDYIRIGNAIYRFLAGGNIEAEYHEEIHRLSIMDPLTGVHNRRSLNEFLDREVERARRHDRPLSVVLFDIDHFKRINDQYGHTAGDFTLRNVAARVKELTRQDELLARYGGEEFALVLPETGLDRALVTAERVRRAVAAAPYEYEGKTFLVTVSGGVGVLPPGGTTTALDVLRRADDCLYEAKRAGRNRVAPFDRVGRAETPPPQISETATVENVPCRSGAHP